MPNSKKLNILKKAKNTKIIFNEKFSDLRELDVSECKLELRFNREIIIEGCKGVIDYSSERISINVEKGIIIIEGANLHLHSFQDNCAIIKGVFTNVGFEV